ncbi:MAG: alpha/beta hydrolase [Ferruginibacter sp.]
MKTIVFIHGMFQNDRSWKQWISFFEEKGYACIAKPWPFHDGSPVDLRQNIPDGLGHLHLQTVIDEFAQIVSENPQAILIGHSVGGLIVQSLINKGMGTAGVCIDSVAPNRMLAFDWGFVSNSIAIANPLMGDGPYVMSPEDFQKNFTNTMEEHEGLEEYVKTATHDSRNMLRDCMTQDGHVDLDLPHAPLLFIAGEADEIIPPELNEKNAKAYTDDNSICDYKLFPNRGHYICGQPGWEEVAEYVAAWLEKIKN